ncbi:4Fe-4S dicluster domain-containing protein [Rhodobacteraceae bacterium 2CG4]|uniref:4Fe-4S dicluster domain-containing protein n=1 Tax=Halovulum marinum TaxID=2662447 RepID=A0A6L5Z0X4_9RHOB|nr:4Fe-4S binding protein [Halovulum marinum]MSU90138.1 4Fe-4S dicluster domain-containing protein [Halovulum marinum]
MAEKLLLCDCEGSQAIDRDRIADATGMTCSRVHTALCTRELGTAAEALKAGGCRIACGQEQAVFQDLADELGVDAPGFVDLRDRAGWTDDADAAPKMAALVAEAAMAPVPVRTLDVVSGGMCIVIGRAEVALPAAERLAQTLTVTALLPEGDELPLSRAFDAVTGTLRKAEGSLGRFRLQIDALRQLRPGGRGGFALSAPRDGGAAECDVLLDLSGGTPLFPADHKRDGYLRADPGDPLAVAAAVHEASHMIGTFEKPLYVTLEEHLCAHSRARQTGCTRCLDACPTGAIRPDGDHVAVDPLICAGCGACSALCPSGAISYDAPSPQTLFTRMRKLAATYAKAGGGTPRLLVHDAEHGAEMIRLGARFGRGLPADVIPLELETISGFGHAEVLAALASGFGAVDILLAPRTERTALDHEAALTRALLDGAPLRLLDPADPDALSDALYGRTAERLAEPVLVMGARRQVTRTAVKALRGAVEQPIPLPAGAPYGAVLVDLDACTLCLSCAGLCPSGALGDNPDSPQLLFQEDACLQCGICANVCPEDAITLEPRFDTSDAALRQRVLKEEEPYACVECGKLFGVKSTIERIVAQLEGKHPMFADSDKGRMIRMCDDCRVNAQYHSENNPFAGPARPKVRTTDDYLN